MNSERIEISRLYIKIIIKALIIIELIYIIFKMLHYLLQFYS